MDLKQAYTILEVAEYATEEEIPVFRDLSGAQRNGNPETQKEQ